jgi:tRNA uridine 5-carbamoylmethylation protein Kti12
MKPTLIAMVGLPRSGKSTIVGGLSKTLGCPVVRRDAIRLAVHGQRYLGPVEPFIKVLDIYMIKSLFLAGHEVVICDETNYSRAARDHMRTKNGRQSSTS